MTEPAAPPVSSPPFVPQRLNPYAPYPGTRPAVLAGRTAHILAATRRLDAVEQGRTAPPLFFVGPRGLGKTALLDEIRELAEERTFVVAFATAGTGDGLVDILTSAIRKALRNEPVELVRRVLKTFSQVSVTLKIPGVEIGLDGSPDLDDHGLVTLAAALHELSTAVQAAGHAGIVIVVDEIHQASKENLSHLLPALQELGKPPYSSSIWFVGAGVVSTPRVLGAVHGFAERFEYRDLDRLDDLAATYAFTGVPNSEVAWQPSAIEAAVKAADGHPHVIQSIGHYAWEQSEASNAISPVILLEDIEVASAIAARDVERIFSARWEDRTDAERDVLGVLSQHPEGITRDALNLAIVLPRDQVETAVRALYDDGWLEVRDLHLVVFAYAGIMSVVQGRLGPTRATENALAAAPTAKRHAIEPVPVVNAVEDDQTELAT